MLMLAPTARDAAHPSTINRARLAVWLCGSLTIAGLLGCGIHFGLTGQFPLVRRENVWSIAIYEGPSPLQLAPVAGLRQPVLTGDNVSDVSARFVADPFMLQDEDTWYMFFEVLNEDTDQGDIGLATSPDGLAWTYQSIVLDEPFHLSYPAVFRWNDRYYMLPESSEAGAVRLYEATSFPAEWRFVGSLLTGDRLADPTLFRHAEKWWLFVGRSHTHDGLQLFFADELAGPWIEHPQSPLVDKNADIARPGGPVIQFESQLYRFAQDCHPKYGNQLRAFRITRLTTSHYAEEPLEAGPVLAAGGQSWNAAGMHHSDPHLLPDQRWRSCVDGHRKVWFFHF